jgi:hypothetical protein
MAFDEVPAGFAKPQLAASPAASDTTSGSCPPPLASVAAIGMKIEAVATLLAHSVTRAQSSATTSTSSHNGRPAISCVS